jgi:hypothetical protein
MLEKAANRMFVTEAVFSSLKNDKKDERDFLTLLIATTRRNATIVLPKKE